MVVQSTSDLRDFWFILDHADRPGVESFELAPVDLCEVEVEIEAEDAAEVVNPILGAKTLFVGLSSAFNTEVMLFELSGVPSVLCSCACRLGDGSKGAARLDNVEVDPLLVAVDLLLTREGRVWCS